MPTRLVREGIISSDRVDKLDWQAEVFYRRLLNKVDDHGLYDARPSVLRSSLYPLRVDRVREADCTRWLVACEQAGLIVLYDAEGKPYLKVLDTRWQTRSEPKYPVPTTVNSGLQLQTPVPVVVVGDVVVDVDGRKNPLPPSGAFLRFWTAWPPNARKHSRGKCWTLWRQKDFDQIAQEIMAHVEALKASGDWQRGYVPAPLVYLNQRRWEGAEMTDERELKVAMP
jgi:hypothetical protein